MHGVLNEYISGHPANSVLFFLQISMNAQQVLICVDLEIVLIIMMEHFMNVIVKLEQQPQEQVLMVLSHALVGVFLPLVSACIIYLL